VKKLREPQKHVIFFDVAKAFDRVPFSELLKTLEEHFELPRCLLKLTHSYLHNRQIRVKVGQTMSSAIPVRSGVPQGSVLGPLLFIAFVDKVSSLKISEGGASILYADDMVYTHAVDTVDSNILIQGDVAKIEKCFADLKQTLNVKKCKVVVFSLASQVSEEEFAVTLNGKS
jgi:ribonucleases P/MRP protein subunit RPP40